MSNIRLRAVCKNTPQCESRSHHLYCPYCCRPLLETGPAAPPVHLPLPLHMYRHPAERIGKSTSVHAKVVAYDDTTLFVDDCKALGADAQRVHERYPDPSRVLLLYPSKDAKPLSQLPRSSFDTLIVLDGTWKQAKTMYNALKHVGFQSVTIGFSDSSAIASIPRNDASSESHSSTTHNQAHGEPGESAEQPAAPVKTLFWRFQDVGEHCLATIEAVYYFYRDYFNIYEEGEYDGRYDGLLYYFKMQYDAVQSYYRERPDIAFTKRKTGSEQYIKYEGEEEINRVE